MLTKEIMFSFRFFLSALRNANPDLKVRTTLAHSLQKYGLVVQKCLEKHFTKLNKELHL